MTNEQLKECNRIFWLVKGHLIPQSWSENDILSMYDQYTKRIWGNHEATFHEEGFEQAWNAREVVELPLVRTVEHFVPLAYRPLQIEYQTVGHILRHESYLYSMTEKQFVDLCIVYSHGNMNPLRAKEIFRKLMEEAGRDISNIS